MNSPFEYKEELIKILKDYNPLVVKELNNFVSIEIKNNNDNNLLIDLDDEITISFGNWHCHYYYEDKDDFDEAMNKVLNILNNNDCILLIYSNNNLLGSGSSLDKSKYDETEALDFLKSFFGNFSLNGYNNLFRENGVTIKFVFWNEKDNYELTIDKSHFK